MRYIYVQAIVKNAEVGSPGAIRFRHTILNNSDNASDAYVEGQYWADAFEYHPNAETVNDYVISLEEEA